MKSWSSQNSLIKTLALWSTLIISLLTINAVHASDRAQSAWQALDQGATLIDVRTPQEFASGHLDNAINMPLNDLGELATSLDANTTIVVYCRSGSRASQAKQQLHEMGFSSVYNGGGLEEMQASQP